MNRVKSEIWKKKEKANKSNNDGAKKFVGDSEKKTGGVKKMWLFLKKLEKVEIGKNVAT